MAATPDHTRFIDAHKVVHEAFPSHDMGAQSNQERDLNP
jgi:hypothetical protein